MDPTAMNVKGVTDLVRSGVNKLLQSQSEFEGVVGDKEDLLELKKDDPELLAMAAVADAKYAPYEGKIKPRQSANKAYYLGQQMLGSPQAADYPIASNLLFEAEETFLPAALSKNPEPVVWSDDTTEGAAIASDVKTMLQYHSDVLVLRRKMNRMTRQWSIYLIGALKHGWDFEIGDIKTETVDPRNFVFDPDGYIDEYGDYRGGLLGYRVTTTAKKVCDLFPSQAAFVTVMVGGFLATKVTYTEWRTDEFCFYTFKNRVLDKHKNELFNYAKTVRDLDEDGAVVEKKEEGRNHFARPKMPYTFLSVFSIGEEPHDMTGLIEQNIPQQNRITKRDVQIDKNLDRSNNSIGLSGANFNEETAKQAANALEKGHPVLIPSGGPISEAIARFPAPSLPDAMFTAQENDKTTLRSIFGTQGISSQKPDEDQTARGMILQQSFDTSRIGGGIGDALEQVADNVFNWWVQLYYVFYDEAHYASILGQLKAVEYVQFSSMSIKKRLVVSVSPNSMKPKDEVTEMNQAMALWDKGIMDPKTLYTVLDFPDPQKTAAQAVLWRLDPQMYMQMNFPDLAQEMAARQQAAMAAAAGGGIMPAGEGVSPEQANGEPAAPLSKEPASAALANVPLPA